MENQKDILEQIRSKKMESLSSDFLADMAKEIHRSESKKVIPIHRKPLIYILTSAAACAIFVLVSVLSTKPSEEISLSAELKEISSSELLAYVDAHIEEFEEELLGEFVANFDLTESNTELEPSDLTVDSKVSSPKLEDLESDDILEYLQEEGYDVYDEDFDDFI